MFVDLVGSTALAARLDPEDMGAVIRALSEALRRGDRALGRPRRQVHGRRRAGLFRLAAGARGRRRAGGAGRAGDDRGGRAADAPAGEPLAARVGIATGLVVVGELIGEGAAQEQTVVGETPNLAARLQALGRAGQRGRSARRRAGCWAGCSSWPTSGRSASRASPSRSRRGGSKVRVAPRAGSRRCTASGLTPLVGREHELGILLERWAWAKDGDGQVVLLSGEPGIGKSRLLRALRERLGDEPYTPLSHYCSPYHTNSALYPVIGLLERAARLDRDDPPEVQLAKLEAVLAPLERSAGRGRASARRPARDPDR